MRVPLKCTRCTPVLPCTLTTTSGSNTRVLSRACCSTRGWSGLVEAQLGCCLPRRRRTNGSAPMATATPTAAAAEASRGPTAAPPAPANTLRTGGRVHRLPNDRAPRAPPHPHVGSPQQPQQSTRQLLSREGRWERGRGLHLEREAAAAVANPRLPRGAAAVRRRQPPRVVCCPPPRDAQRLDRGPAHLLRLSAGRRTQRQLPAPAPALWLFRCPCCFSCPCCLETAGMQKSGN